MLYGILSVVALRAPLTRYLVAWVIPRLEERILNMIFRRFYKRGIFVCSEGLVVGLSLYKQSFVVGFGWALKIRISG